MADGKDNFKEIPAPAPGGDSSQRLISDTQVPVPVKPADVSKVGDKHTAQAAPTGDVQAYASDVPTGLKDSHYPGGANNPQQNFEKSGQNIAAIYDKVTTTEGKAALDHAAHQMLVHLQTPGLKEVMPH